jgi:hypothetical protein
MQIAPATSLYPLEQAMDHFVVPVHGPKDGAEVNLEFTVGGVTIPGTIGKSCRAGAFVRWP